MPWLGVDVGGTFTDLVLYDEAAGTLVLASVGKIGHGTTVGWSTSTRGSPPARPRSAGSARWSPATASPRSSSPSG